MSTKKEIKYVDSRESIRVVTTNSFITACGLEKASLKARKLLYLAIAQCQKNDNEFYEYSISARDFADIMGIAPNHVYQEADKITDEIFGSYITERADKRFEKYTLFSKCMYDEGILYFKLNSDMMNFLLQIKGSFSQPLLADFVKMKSPKSMAIWHVFQREMHSKKPYANNEICFTLSLVELRQVTESTDSFTRLSDFKRYILDKALREIIDNCGVAITYKDIKKGRTVIGFNFIAKSPFNVTS